MTPSSTSARTLAALLLLQLAGLIAPFAMIHPMLPADFLTTAAAHAGQVKLAVVFFVLNCGLTIGISLFLRPLLRAGGESTALLLILASGILFTLQAVDNAHLLSMLSLSERSAGAGGEGELLRAMGETVRSTRRWVHYATLLSIEVWMFTLYTALYRAKLVPRTVALFGLATVVMHFGGVVAPFFLGRPSIMVLAMSMGISQLVLVLWLATVGFSGRRLTPMHG